MFSKHEEKLSYELFFAWKATIIHKQSSKKITWNAVYGFSVSIWQQNDMIDCNGFMVSNAD